MTKALIIPAAGSGKRMKRQQPKPFIKLGDKTILEHTITKFLEVEGLQQIIVATSASFIEKTEKILSNCTGADISWQCVEGGDERQHSIHKALKCVKETELVIVHDAVRPFIEMKSIKVCCKKAEEMGAAVVGIPVKNTIKKVDEDGMVTETPDRKKLWQIQTPQVFRTKLLKEAYKKAAEQNFIGTDDASLIEWLGKPVGVVKVSASNIKITYPQDLKFAQFLLQNETEAYMKDIRIGHGYDVHRLVEGRPLILGGVKINHPKGLAGHSDADVLLHAITDALLGTLALGDLGKHFPDTDATYENIDSRKLLRKAAELIRKKDYQISNVDATIVAQEPKLAPYIKKMSIIIAEDLGLAEDRISVKATTSENLGFEGMEQGISVSASVLIFKD